MNVFFIKHTNIKIMYKYFLYILIIVFITLSSPTNGTTIIVIRGDNRVFIGADSKATFEKDGCVYNTCVCKIVKVDSFFVAVSGVVTPCKKINPALFSPIDIARSILCDTVDTRTSICMFSDSLRVAFDKIVFTKWQTDTTEAKTYRSNVFIVRVKKEKPIFYSIEHSVIKGDLCVPYKIKSKPQEVPCFGTYGPDIISKCKHIKKFRDRNPEFEATHTPVEIIKKFISIDVDSCDVTGGYIDILEVRPDDWEWHDRKPKCYKEDKI